MAYGNQWSWTCAAMIAVGCALPGAALAAPVKHRCGAPISSVVATDDAVFITQDTKNIPGAAAKLTVPVGEERCVKVRFFAEMSCQLYFAPSGCTFSAIDESPDGVFLLDPPVNGVTFASENIMTSPRAFEWVKRVGPGDHKFRIQASVQGSVQGFFPTLTVSAWIFDMEVTE